MTVQQTASARAVINADDITEYDLRIGRLRELIQEHGFDAFIANEFGVAPGRPNYVRFLSHFRTGAGVPVIAVVPLSGEPTLLVAPGFNGTYPFLAERQSWIRNVVPLETKSTRASIMVGPGADSVAASLAAALRDSGLESGRLAVAGTWPALEEAKALLPDARFESSVVTDASGGQVDLFESVFHSTSPWKIQRLEAANTAANAAKLAYIAAARRGATILEAAREGRAAAITAGADEIRLHGGLSADPWAYWNLEIATPGEGFKDGQMYLIQVASCGVDDNATQTGRTFVIGKPTKAQRHLMDMMKWGFETMMANIEIGKTGREIWASVNPTIEKEGLAEWSQYGHNGGPGGRAISFSNEGAPANGVVSEGHLLEVHPTLYDPVSGDHGMSGDCIVIENGRARNLALDPLPHDLL